MITRLWCKIWGHKVELLDCATVSWVYCKRCAAYLKVMER